MFSGWLCEGNLQLLFNYQIRYWDAPRSFEMVKCQQMSIWCSYKISSKRLTCVNANLSIMSFVFRVISRCACNRMRDSSLSSFKLRIAVAVLSYSAKCAFPLSSLWQATPQGFVAELWYSKDCRPDVNYLFHFNYNLFWDITVSAVRTETYNFAFTYFI